MSAKPGPRVLVACIGSSLVCDDRVGEAVHRRLAGATQLPAGTRVVHLGVGGTQLVDVLRAEALLIVVDAVRFDAPPGTVHVVELAEMAATPHRGFAHDVGVPQALELTRVLFPERVPLRSVLVGVQGRCFDRIGEMSLEVAAAIDQATATVVDLANQAQRAPL